MKYIRTKDGKIHNLEMGWIVSSLYDGSEELKKHYHRYRHIQNGDSITLTEEFFTSDDIVNQADTIEELCDEFVIKIKTGYLITYYNKVLLTQDANKNGADVYGAIWTDEGLIYKAKMKGVLPNGEIDWELL